MIASRNKVFLHLVICFEITEIPEEITPIPESLPEPEPIPESLPEPEPVFEPEPIPETFEIGKYTKQISNTYTKHLLY